MTTLSDKIRAFMIENEKELVEEAVHGEFEDILVLLARQNEDEDRGQMARTIAEVRYENREM